jgi:hypothetical protein
MHYGKNVARCALDFGARAERLELALSVRHHSATILDYPKLHMNHFYEMAWLEL